MIGEAIHLVILEYIGHLREKIFGYSPGKEDFLVERITHHYGEFHGKRNKSARKGREKIKTSIALLREHCTGTRGDGKTPEIYHGLWVANELAKRGHRVDEIVLGGVHDLTEDKNVRVSKIRSLFGESVARALVVLTKPRLIGETWIFADDKKFYTGEDRYTPERYDERAEVYYARLLNSANIIVLAVKLWDNIHNAITIMGLPEEKRSRNMNTMIRNTLRLAPILLTPEDCMNLVTALKKVGAELPADAFPEAPEGKIVMLPPRLEVARDVGHLPPSTANYITIYAPDEKGAIELGFPRGFRLPGMGTLKSMFGSTKVTEEKSLVAPGMGPFEIIIKVCGTTLGGVKKVVEANFMLSL